MFSRFASRLSSSAFKRSFSTSTASSTASKRSVVYAVSGAAGLGLAAYSAFNFSAEASNTAGSKSFSTGKDFVELELIGKTQYNHNTSVFRLALPESETLEMPVASFILLGAPIESNGETKFIVRPYTPLNHDGNSIDLLIKTYEQGNLSKYVDSLQQGETIKVKGPLAKMSFSANDKKQIAFVAGGTGITPMYQVITHLLAIPEDKTELTLIFANNTEEDILLKQKLDSLAEAHERFNVVYVVSEPSQDWSGPTGYVTENLLKEHLPKPSADNLVCVCGPPPMVAAISGSKAPDYSQGEVAGLLKNLQWDKSNVFKF